MTPEDLLKDYENALASQDWKVLEPLFHKDICVTFNDGTYKGKPAVQEAFEKTFALIQDEKYAISNLHWVKKTADYAVCLYNFTWEGIIDGEPASGGGRGTSVLVNEDNRWLLLTEHLGPP